MSQNQTRGEKKEKQQYRKTGGGVRSINTSSDQLFSSFPATGRGASPAPPLSPSNHPSFKKSSNAQGGQSRGHLGSVNTTSGPNPASSGVHPVENGNYVKSALHGISSPPAQAAANPADTSIQKSSQPISKTKSAPMTAKSSLPSTPPKGEAGKGFALQFGSISPGFMNGLQVPARTSSAPPDLDEQSHDKVHHSASRASPANPVPSTLRQQVPEKHGAPEQSIVQETHNVSHVSRESQVTTAPSPVQPMQAQKPAMLHMGGMSMPMPFHQHQPPVPMQFGGPNPQIQGQGSPNNSLQMPMQMPLHIGNPSQVQQQVFVPGLQHHLIQNQGMLHQGQGFGFNPQLGHQLPHQPGNMGMTMSPQFNIQQPGNAGNIRKTVKTVKITHPDTREELRLDNRDGGSPGSRSRHVGPSQSQHGPPYGAMRPSGYYSSPYTPGPPVFPVPNSVPISAQLQISPGSQAPRFNYPQAPPTVSFTNQSASNSSPTGKSASSLHGVTELSGSDFSRSVQTMSPSVHLTSPQVTVKTVDSASEKAIDSNDNEKSEAQKLVMSSVDPGAVCEDKEENVDVIKKETMMNSEPTREFQKNHEMKEHFQSSLQADSNALQERDVGNNTGHYQQSTQNYHLVQESQKQGGKELGGMQSGSVCKTVDLIKMAQGESEFAEGDEAAFQEIPSENLSTYVSDDAVGPASVNSSESNSGQEGETTEKARPISSSAIVSGSNKSFVDSKNNNNKGKKKRKEMLQKADALGTTTDLYMAYKGPEERNETIAVGESGSRSNLEGSYYTGVDNSLRKKKDESSKLELEDWEDAVDVSTQKLASSIKGENRRSHQDGGLVKKYSRDFLLTFSEQCSELPDDFQIMPDIADILLHLNVASYGDSNYGHSGRFVDRASGAARHDLRANGMMGADRWNRPPPRFSGWDPGMDLAYSNNMIGFRSGPGPNYGVLRNTHGQGPIHHVGGILSGPIHSMGFHGVQRNNSEMERWQRATSFNKGLMLAPQTPSPLMHRAENKYEVGKVSDEEQAKQRKLKAILNKLTPQNFDKLFEQVKEVNIDNAVTLTGVISQIFDKALTEPTFCEMYANFCFYLASELPDLSIENEKITFKRLLLNKCQEEFERNEREEEEANKADDDGDNRQTEEERERKRLNARRRMLGNIRLIGELYKKRMLTERIMHECIKKLLGQYQNADEENIEALCKLMSTIGEMIDHHKAKEHMDAYFDIMEQLSNNTKLSSRVRFMLKDAIDLRKNKWQQRRKVEGPKKIEEVHRDAAQERLGQAGRMSRGGSMSSTMRRGQPVEYTPRGSMLPSPAGQMGGFRSLSGQVRGYGGQDARTDDRSVFEGRTLSVPLPHHSSGDEPIMLGPQGGLARGMSCRGQPSVSNAPSADNTYHGESRRMVSGLNGFSNALDRGVYRSRDDHFSRQASERFGGAPVGYDRSGGQHHNSVYTNRDVRNPDRTMGKPTQTLSYVARAIPAESSASEKVLPEERLRSLCMEAIKEYYSANDEKEVALCIKDLNALKFYPTAISMWVSDAFERKDLERDMLAKLLVSLTKTRDGVFSPQQLSEGFEFVLANLEDTVTDAPKAPEFLGRIFGKVILENALPFKEVGRLIYKGGEEPGRLLEIGLAADVLGTVLEMIKSEKGESTLIEIRTSSGIRLEDFRPPDPLKSKKLEMFIM